MFKQIITSIVAGAAMVMPATASNSSGLDSLVYMSLDMNPAISASRLRAEAEAREMEADNYLESPELEFEHLWGTDQNRWSASVSQSFDWPGAYKARSKEQASARTAREAALAIIVYDKALSCKLAMLDVINARARLTFFEEVDSNLRRIASLTELAYEHGEATILDLYKTRIALLDSEGRLKTAIAEIENLLAILQGYSAAGMPDARSTVWTSYPDQLPFISTDPRDYPQYALFEARDALSSSREQVVKMEALPSFSLGYVHAYEDRNHFNGLSVSFTLPSFSRNKRLEAVRASQAADMVDYHAEIMQLSAQNAALYSETQQLAEVMSRYEGLSNDNSYLDLLRQAYDGGELTIIEYITEINLFAESRLSYLDLQYRYNMAVARLNCYHSITF